MKLVMVTCTVAERVTKNTIVVTELPKRTRHRNLITVNAVEPKTKNFV